jgi:heat shock protein HslJ
MRPGCGSSRRSRGRSTASQGDIYQGRRISLNIVHGQRCSDGMSDRVYRDKVQVRVDDRSFEGCGDSVEPPSPR